MDIDKCGKMPAASIPATLCEAAEEGRIEPGDRVLLLAFGAGLTWAAAVVTRGVPELRVSWRIPWDLVRRRVSVGAAADIAHGAGAALFAAPTVPFGVVCSVGEQIWARLLRLARRVAVALDTVLEKK